MSWEDIKYDYAHPDFERERTKNEENSDDDQDNESNEEYDEEHE
jgi:hypothetical protein